MCFFVVNWLIHQKSTHLFFHSNIRGKKVTSQPYFSTKNVCTYKNSNIYFLPHIVKHTLTPLRLLTSCTILQGNAQLAALESRQENILQELKALESEVTTLAVKLKTEEETAPVTQKTPSQPSTKTQSSQKKGTGKLTATKSVPKADLVSIDLFQKLIHFYIWLTPAWQTGQFNEISFFLQMPQLKNLQDISQTVILSDTKWFNSGMVANGSAAWQTGQKNITFLEKVHSCKTLSVVIWYLLQNAVKIKHWYINCQ